MKVSVTEAYRLLRKGNVVALPTETVYGLAAAIDQPNAIQSIFDLKKRPQDNPLIVHGSSYAQIKALVAEIPPQFQLLAEAFWPGPLTIVLPSEKVASTIRAGLPTTAFRIPEHFLTHRVLAETGPLVMPSANLSGRPSATCVAHVEADFGADFPVLDGGQCPVGVESTILMYHSERWVMLRLGAITKEKLENVLGYAPEFMNEVGAKPLCPGQKYRHYAPKAKLSPNLPLQVIIGFSDRDYGDSTVYVLGRSDSPVEVAENLYAVLRQLDEDGVQEAALDLNFPNTGLWNTIRERLLKASS